MNRFLDDILNEEVIEMSNNLKCPFKGGGRTEECDREKCVLWHEGGCVFVHIARDLGIIGEMLREKGTMTY